MKLLSLLRLDNFIIKPFVIKIIKISIYFFIFFTNAQKIKFDQIASSQFSMKIKKNKIESLLKKNKKKDSLFFLKIYYAKWLYNNKDFRGAIQTTEKLLESTNKKQEVLFWIGYFYRDVNIIKSNLFFNKAFDQYKQTKISQRALYCLANNYINLNNFDKANEYFKLLIKLQQEQGEYDIYAKISYYQMANNFFYKKDSLSLVKAIAIMNKIESELYNITLSKQQQYAFLTLRGSLYNEETNLNIKLSYKYYKHALKIANNLKDNTKIFNTYLRLASLYNTTNFKKSIYYLNKITTKNNDSILISEKAFNYALLYYYNKGYKKSITYFHKALLYLEGEKFKKIGANDYLLLPSFKNKSRFLHILPFLAKTYYKYYKQTKKIKYLENSILYYKFSDQLIDLIKQNSTSFKSRMFWREKSEKIYSRALDACFEDNNIEDALFFMEKNKALLLSEDISTQNYKLSLSVDFDKLAKEKKIKKQLNKIERERSINKDTLLQEKLKIEQELNLYQDSIYHGKLKKQYKLINYGIKTIQNKLKENEVFLEYHISGTTDFGIFGHNKKAYLILITKKQTFLKKIDNVSALKRNLKFYFKLIKKPFNTKEDKTLFLQKSYQLFSNLFPTEEIKNVIKNKKLIIVPDGLLSLLPFESLITTKMKLNYLIYQSEISYLYSFAFQQANNNVERKAKKNILSMAPVQYRFDSLWNLPNTKKEVYSINKIIPSKTLLYKEATKESFNKWCKDYKIIHLATHAVVNDKSPISNWIAFNNSKLYQNELNTIKTQADLIVLSACNTNVGKL